MSFGPGASSGAPSRNAPAAALGDPLLAGAEVVDVAEVDVVHRRAVGDREREREERDPALRVDRAVDRVDDDARAAPPAPNARTPSSSETSVRSRPSASSRRTTASSAAASIAVVSSPPSPGAEHGLALGTRRQRRRARRRGRATHARENSSQSVTGRPGGTAARRRASGRSTSSSAASPRRSRARSKTSSIRVGRRRSAQSASPDSTRRTASTRSGVYEIPSWPSRSTSSTSSSPGVPVHEPRSTRDARGLRPSARTARSASAAYASSTVGNGSPAEVDVRAVRANTRWVGKISSPGSDVETRTTSIRSAPSSAANATRGLVAVVAVGDQELAPAKNASTPSRRRRARGACRRRRGRARVSGERAGRAVVEQEDRLELGARRAQQPQAALLRTARASARAGAPCPSRTARRGATRRCPPRRRSTPSGPT